MPKIFVASEMKQDQVFRTVIDGQQRISAILAFLKDQYSLEKPYTGNHKGKFFSQLPGEVRHDFFQYRVDFNEAIDFSDEDLRETYSRLNKYSVALTKQELRRADFPGDFLKLSEDLAVNEYLEESKIFTVANRRRLADVEFVSELVAGLIDGPQDKRDNLDSFYLKYSIWPEIEQKEVELRFLNALEDIANIFCDEMPLQSTRFRQKADFYALLLAVDGLKRQGGNLEGVELEDLRQDLGQLNYLIAPESDNRDCRDYAIKCVSQANSLSSRRWRIGFLKAILAGTYVRSAPVGDARVLFYRILTSESDPMCPPAEYECSTCGSEISTREVPIVAWRKDCQHFQMSNACRLHIACSDSEKWHILNSEGTDIDLSFTD